MDILLLMLLFFFLMLTGMPIEVLRKMGGAMVVQYESKRLQFQAVWAWDEIQKYALGH